MSAFLESSLSISTRSSVNLFCSVSSSTQCRRLESVLRQCMTSMWVLYTEFTLLTRGLTRMGTALQIPKYTFQSQHQIWRNTLIPNHKNCTSSWEEQSFSKQPKYFVISFPTVSHVEAIFKSPRPIFADTHLCFTFIPLVFSTIKLFLKKKIKA